MVVWINRLDGKAAPGGPIVYKLPSSSLKFILAKFPTNTFLFTMHAEATVTWYAAHLAASFSRYCYSYSFQPSPVVKHTDTAWLFPTFIAFQVVCASGSKGTQIDLMYEWTHFLVFMDIAPDSLVNFSGAPHITIDGSIFSAHQLHSLHFPP